MQMQDEDGAQSLPTPEKIMANIMEGTFKEHSLRNLNHTTFNLQ